MRTEKEYLKLENELLKKEIEILKLKQKASEDIFKFVPLPWSDPFPGRPTSTAYNPFHAECGDSLDSRIISLDKVI